MFLMAWKHVAVVQLLPEQMEGRRAVLFANEKESGEDLMGGTLSFLYHSHQFCMHPIVMKQMDPVALETFEMGSFPCVCVIRKIGHINSLPVTVLLWTTVGLASFLPSS